MYPRPCKTSLVVTARDCQSQSRWFDSGKSNKSNIEKSNLHGFAVHRPSSKGTKSLFHIIKATINQLHSTCSVNTLIRKSVDCEYQMSYALLPIRCRSLDVYVMIIQKISTDSAALLHSKIQWIFLFHAEVCKRLLACIPLQSCVSHIHCTQDRTGVQRKEW